MKYIIFDGSDINKIKNYKFISLKDIEYIKIKIYEFLKNNFRIFLQEINYIEVHDNISSFYMYIHINVISKKVYILNFNYQGELFNTSIDPFMQAVGNVLHLFTSTKFVF